MLKGASALGAGALVGLMVVMAFDRAPDTPGSPVKATATATLAPLSTSQMHPKTVAPPAGGATATPARAR